MRPGNHQIQISGNALIHNFIGTEGKVVLQANPEMYGFLQPYEQDLPGLFIVSQVELKKITRPPHEPDFAVEVAKADGTKCVRCWNYRPAVGANAAHPELCDRCVEAVA